MCTSPWQRLITSGIVLIFIGFAFIGYSVMSNILLLVVGIILLLTGLALLAVGYRNRRNAYIQAPAMVTTTTTVIQPGNYQPGSYPTQGGYPQMQGTYPPTQGYPPTQAFYPPTQQYPPTQGNYPPTNVMQPGYPQYPAHGMQPGYPPMQGTYPPQNMQADYKSGGGKFGEPPNLAQPPSYNESMGLASAPPE